MKENKVIMNYSEDLVSFNAHIIVKYNDICKIHKLIANRLEIKMGNDLISLDAVVGKPFWTAYKLKKKDQKRVFTLTEVADYSQFISDKVMISGVDNRNIEDDGSSQMLSTSDIVTLRSSGMSADKIVESLIENSKTFSSKTEFSQEKYLKKKEKKYLDLVIIKKLTFRTMAEVLLPKCKVFGLRMDSLAQITTQACVRSGCSYMVYETGCRGLITAALLNALGLKGTIIHVHNGNNPEKQALNYMDFEQERIDQILCVSIFHLLKKFNNDHQKNGPSVTACDMLNSDNLEEPPAKRPKWELREEKAIEYLRAAKVDGLIVVGKEEPSNILRNLLQFVHPSRPFVVFSGTREPLLHLFLQLKNDGNVTALRLNESWLRSYQVLPDRTHPNVNMSGSGGSLLSGLTINSSCN